MTILGKLRMARYVLKGLEASDLDADPMVQFNDWYRTARKAGLHLPEAMTLATADLSGNPSARMMLLKGADSRGFVFFTNYKSRKAGELFANPRASLVFHWSELMRQVRVEGQIEKLSPEESEAYFHTRPRGSQIGAWASHQSAELHSRAELEQRVRELENTYRGQTIPRPPYWGGILLIPERIEFWQGRACRLHDRLCYTQQGGRWTIHRLSP